MATRMQQRRDTSANWGVANPILADGEIGVAKDTGVVKIGDGVNSWNNLNPAFSSQYLPLLGKAADSDKLGGYDSTSFLKTADATSTYLSQTAATASYLPLTGKAADSDKLDGFDSTVFQKITDSGDIVVTAFGTGFSGGTETDSVTYRRRNGIAQGRGVVFRDATNRVGTMFTLPTGFRPSYPVWDVLTNQGNNVGELKVMPDGTVLWNSSLNTLLAGVFSLMFPVAEVS